MKRGFFEYIIADHFDLEKVFCEIYYKQEEIAIIFQETEELTIKIYPTLGKDCLTIPLDQLQEALEIGKKFLLDKEIPE